MAWYEAGGLMLALLIGCMAIGMPVFLAFLVANAIGVLQFMGGTAGLEQLLANGTITVSSFLLIPVPLFILMGELFFHSGLAFRVFDGLDKLFGRIPGRLSYLAVANGTIFAALTGTSMASAAMMGTTLVPEMMRRGYKPNLAIGPILGAGGLAIIIPPSALAVMFGTIAKVDIGALLIAGVLPGLLLATLYAATILLQLKIDPEAAPEYNVRHFTIAEKLYAVSVNILPMGLIIFAVIGLMLLGFATPTESAAFGALAVIVLAAVYRCLTRDVVIKSFLGTAKITVMIFMILIGSSTYSQVMAFSGASAGFLDWSINLTSSPMLLLIAMFVILLILGCFVDQVSQMMLTIPIFMPVITTLGFDPIWFGVIVMIGMEISLITPPFGLLLFVLAGVVPRSIGMMTIIRAGIPYVICGCIAVALIIIFPEVALFLPRAMAGR